MSIQKKNKNTAIQNTKFKGFNNENEKVTLKTAQGITNFGALYRIAHATR